MRVTIEVTEAQHAEMKRQAGMVPLARWIKHQLFPASDEDRAKELIPLLRKSIEKSKEIIDGRADKAIENPATGRMGATVRCVDSDAASRDAGNFGSARSKASRNAVTA